MDESGIRQLRGGLEKDSLSKWGEELGLIVTQAQNTVRQHSRG